MSKINLYCAKYQNVTENSKILNRKNMQVLS